MWGNKLLDTEKYEMKNEKVNVYFYSDSFWSFSLFLASK